MKCPPYEDLIEYSLGKMPETAGEDLGRHLSGCNDCTRNIESIRLIKHVAFQDKSFDFPEDTIQGLVAWFRSQPPFETQSVWSWTATLIFDSLTPRSPAPVRADSTGGTAVERQMLYQTEGFDIDLKFEAGEDQFMEDVIGQVLPRTDPNSNISNLKVCLRQGDHEIRSTETDVRGLFTFNHIPSGVYDLKVDVAGGEINIVQVSTARHNPTTGK